MAYKQSKKILMLSRISKFTFIIDMVYEKDKYIHSDTFGDLKTFFPEKLS